MNVAVCVKQVLDSSIPLRVVNGVVQQDTPWPIAHLGAADRAALEQAMAVRAQLSGRVTAISVGGAEAVEALRFCLGRGADRAVHVKCGDSCDAVAAATAVAAALVGEPLDLVLCGGASGDGASGLFPAVLAARFDWPLVTAVAAVRVEQEARHFRSPLAMGSVDSCLPPFRKGGPGGICGASNLDAAAQIPLSPPFPKGETGRVLDLPTLSREEMVFTIERRLERGDREIVRCSLPAVLAADASAAQPCYVSVRARRRVATVPIDVIPTEGEGRPGGALIALEPARPRAKRVSAPAARSSAMDRLAHALTGGVQQKQGGGFVEGSPDAVAQQIVCFLKEKGFLREPRGQDDG